MQLEGHTNTLLQLRARFEEAEIEDEQLTLIFSENERTNVISAIDNIEKEIEEAATYAEQTEGNVLDDYIQSAAQGLLASGKIPPHDVPVEAFRVATKLFEIRTQVTGQKVKAGREAAEPSNGAAATA